MEQATEHSSRVRKIDWRRVIELVDASEPGTPYLVGVMDQSIRTHIKNGRFSYIDPDRYNVWTEAVEGSRTQARLYMSRKPDRKEQHGTSSNLR